MSTEASQRGPEIAFQGATLITGVALAYWVDFGFTRLSNQVSWVKLRSTQIYGRKPDRPLASSDITSDRDFPSLTLWHFGSPGHSALVL